jgi:glutathione synthase/RimK-type ligase-like ATP-grasp enzyme
MLMARHVLMSAEAMGLKVFPNTATCWHFDDKIAQKYLLEAVGAPLVPSHVFFDLREALAWIDTTEYPKVFKLRRGAGSANVRLVRTADEARSLARRAFGRGFRPVASYGADARTRLSAHRQQRDWVGVVKRMPANLRRIRKASRLLGREAGYIYFQDFIPDNVSDTRVTVIGGRAFSFIRNVRPGDFRASGSGRIVYEMDCIDRRCLRIALDTSRKLGTQSLAYDFVFAPGEGPVLTEVSYAYMAKPVYDCPGYWDESLEWHAGHLWPQDVILTDLIGAIQNESTVTSQKGIESPGTRLPPTG